MLLRENRHFKFSSPKTRDVFFSSSSNFKASSFAAVFLDCRFRPPDLDDFKVIPFARDLLRYPPAAEAGRFMNRPYKSRYPLRFIGDWFSVGGIHESPEPGTLVSSQNRHFIITFPGNYVKAFTGNAFNHVQMYWGQEV